MTVLIIWSVAGAISVVVFAVGATVRLCTRARNSFDVQLAEVERDGKIKELKLENERLQIEAEREGRLLG